MLAKGTTICGLCKDPLEVSVEHPPRVSNYEHVTIIVIQHSGQQICKKCGAVVRPGIIGIAGIQLVGFPVPPEEQDKIIVPGNNLKI